MSLSPSSAKSLTYGQKQKRDRIMVHGGDMVELVVTGANFDEAAAAAPADAAARGALAPWKYLRVRGEEQDEAKLAGV